MSLKELQDFVFNFQRVSLAEMKLVFQIDGDKLRAMLDRLIKKGKVQKSPMTEKCQSCQKCESDELEFYEWSENI
ncbi:hypothetical protein STA3757_03800 [Stanieria sp. NIES-3757]|nr:hypothetical protein STA3757_03800 [Stanieria sp. NIES-3757]